MEEHDIADVIEYQGIYQLCKGNSRYIEFLEMLKKLVNKSLIQINVDLLRSLNNSFIKLCSIYFVF